MHSDNLMTNPDAHEIERSEESAQYKIFYTHQRKMNHLLQERLTEIENSYQTKCLQLVSFLFYRLDSH